MGETYVKIKGECIAEQSDSTPTMPFNGSLEPLIDQRMREDVREDRTAQAALHHATAL